MFKKKNKKKNTGTGVRVRYIHANYVYDDVMDEWLVPFGFSGETPLGFGEGTTLSELFDSVTEQFNRLSADSKDNLRLIHDVDTVESPVDKQAEAATFLALKDANAI